jgi:CspA family cold shock protein
LEIKNGDWNTGTVKWLNDQKGYGFIQPLNGGQDVRSHLGRSTRRLYVS